MAPAAVYPRHTARIARLLLVAALACANVEPPPGGPPDAEPPVVVSMRPESGAVVPGWDEPAVIRFDEVIEEMPGGGLDALILLSPVAGRVRIDWRRSAINVEPREGWKAGRVYHLELRPGIRDLRRNLLTTGRTVIFSTGGPVPDGTLSGTALHWTEQRALPAALIQAAPPADTVPYLALADSSGAFSLGGLPPGAYVVYAVQDQNTNRRRDRGEAYDSLIVRVDSSASVVLWAFVHDSVGPRLRAVDHVDSMTLRLEFTQPFDPTQAIDTSQVAVFALPDTLPVAIETVLTAAEFDSLRARAQAAADSARRAERDTLARTPEEPLRPPRAPLGERLPGVDTAGAAERAADTARVRRLLARRPIPATRLVVRTGQSLAPEARYLVRAAGIRGLTGADTVSQQLFVTPKPPPAPPPPAPPPPTPSDSLRPPVPS